MAALGLYTNMRSCTHLVVYGEEGDVGLHLVDARALAPHVIERVLDDQHVDRVGVRSLPMKATRSGAPWRVVTWCGVV